MSFEDAIRQQQPSPVNDQTRLTLFVGTVYQDLATVVGLREELLGGPIYRDFVDALPGAWNDVNTDSTTAIEAIANSDINQLNLYGLTGDPLQAKLEAWHGARERLVDEFDVGGPIMAPASPLPPVKGLDRLFQRRRPLHRKRALKWLAKTLAHADNILGSLTAAIPMPPVFETLKEIKHAIERAADDTADSLSDDT
jgi:hypothetical protein